MTACAHLEPPACEVGVVAAGPHGLEVYAALAAVLAPTNTTCLVPREQLAKANASAFSAANYSALVVTSSPDLPAGFVGTYVRFAERGGHLVLLGGKPPRLNLTAPLLGLNLMSTYQPYVLRGAVSVNATTAWAAVVRGTHAAGAGPAAVSGSAGPFGGLSAVGWSRPGSLFVPLLDAVDAHGRSAGWAVGCVANSGGAYGRGTWVFSGVSSLDVAFYTSPVVLATLRVAVLRASNTAAMASLAADWWAGAREAHAQRVRDSVAGAWAPAAAPAATGRIRLSPDRLHLLDGHSRRFFMLGADHFRGQFNDGVTAESLADNLNNAVLAGLNTVRMYGLGSPLDPAILGVFRSFYTTHGLRVLFTLECYKDKAQNSSAAVIQRTYQEAVSLASEDWVLGYDLCNEPDDQWNFLSSIVADVATGKTLGDLFPDSKQWGAYGQWQCGGWSTTFGAECRNLSGPVLDQADLPSDARAGFVAVSSMMAAWIGWRRQGFAKAKDTHLITVGNNALHALLPANAALDFVSHHSYASNPPQNSTCTYASFGNVTAISSTLDRLAGVWKGSPRPITFGEFGTRTTVGLEEFYAPPLGPAGNGPPESQACSLPQDCIAGVVSTISWYAAHDAKRTPCGDVWMRAVADNAGPGSAHHRCPAWAGEGTAAWAETAYVVCRPAIIAYGKAANVSVCSPVAPPPCNAITFEDAAAWDVAPWLVSLVHGYGGAIRWSLAEKGYVLSVWSDTWTGDDQASAKAHDMYVAGGRFGLFWYDGTPGGRPKPLACAQSFLRQYLSVSAWATNAYHLSWSEHAPTDSGFVAGFTFTGPDVLVASAASYTSPALNFTSGRVTALVLVARPVLLNGATKIVSTVRPPSLRRLATLLCASCQLRVCAGLGRRGARSECGGGAGASGGGGGGGVCVCGVWWWWWRWWRGGWWRGRGGLA